ncbi:MAG: outer membrane lipoprotein-sorting protein [Fibrobacterales bacterium]
MKKVLLMVLLVGAVSGALANKGYDIAKKADGNQRNFVDEKSISTLTLINAAGDTVMRKMTSITMERDNSKDLSVIQFLNPADVRGTSLLTYQNPTGNDKQWLYLPELRRVKKISSKNKSGSFMGSEFSYEDISGNTLDKWSYTFIKEDSFNGVPCYLVERVPTYDNSGYSKVKVWFSIDNHLMMRAEFFDRKQTLLKVQLMMGWKQYGKTWRFDRIEMENMQNKKKSILDYSKRTFKNGLKKKDFSKRSMQRMLKI